MDLDIDFPMMVRSARTDLGLSIRELAKDIGAPASSLTRLERGEFGVSGSTTLKLIVYLGLDITG